ncbi:MAG: class I SAM-dependent methyltransferase [Candidatus Tectomicrobia bacterium]|uniref:Class I SAM-dependent methyltransferase n=1 Tax=Tectimicrobiota bacterium TaxID=2528274 RepID=A0A937W0Q1_UNCTE|nr:class I SAM-dependent methyltransferase [Candidatus Tectomicrobia bacterium]
MSEALDLAAQQARDKWNARYHESTSTPQAALVLREYTHLLPSTGCALDLACGLGGNALLLAAHGLVTYAWDIAEVAISRLQAAAQQHHVSIQTEVRDVATAPPPPDSFEVIVVSRFLERAIAPALIQALRPGGLLFYQTFTRVSVGEVRGPRNPEYLLAPQELLTLFRPLALVIYREEGQLGDHARGVRNEALFVGQKHD